jgi:ABC-type multidrug transport system fused ATPase/permease subunit
MNLQSRGLMGLFQDSILFNDNKANIALGKLDASDDEIIAALNIMLMNCLQRFTKRHIYSTLVIAEINFQGQNSDFDVREVLKTLNYDFR